MKLSTVIIAGLAAASLAGSVSAAQVFESYDSYYDTAGVFVTNNSASAYSDVNINGTDFGALVAGASSGSLFAGDPYEGGLTSVLVTIKQGAGTYSGTVGLGDFEYGTSGQLVGTIATVPEPAAWALMLVGFAGLGAAVRSSRKAALAA